MKKFISPGMLVILAVVLATSVAVALLPVTEPQGIQFWVIARPQYDSYVERQRRR